MLVYTISKGTNKSYVYDIYRGVKGEKGDQGIQGEQGIQGPAGAAATIQVGSVSSGAAPSVINSGTSSAAIFDFVLEKGEKGDQGPVGQSAGFGTPTASVETLTPGSDATVSVTASGDATQKVFAFSFGIPEGEKGDKGDKGDTGSKGDTGDAAGFGTPTISVTSLTPGSTPTATISASGPDTAKVFDFSLGIPTGGVVWQIEKISYRENSISFKLYKNGVEYDTDVYGKLSFQNSGASEFTRTLGKSSYSSFYFDQTTKNDYIKNASYYAMNLMIYEDSSYTTLLAQQSITKAFCASSIASGVYGYTTGNQVYNYVDTQIGNINTILQSI